MDDEQQRQRLQGRPTGLAVAVLLLWCLLFVVLVAAKLISDAAPRPGDVEGWRSMNLLILPFAVVITLFVTAAFGGVVLAVLRAVWRSPSSLAAVVSGSTAAFSGAFLTGVVIWAFLSRHS